MTTRIALSAIALSLVTSANAAIVHYKGDTSPAFVNASRYKLQSAGELPFHGVKFGGCTMSTDGSAMTLGTTIGQGVWFGYATSTVSEIPLAWSMGTSASGNDLTVRAKLGTAASKEWGSYFYDGSHAANFYIEDDNRLLLTVGSGDLILNYPAGYFDSYREIRSILKAGQIGYYIDGVAVYTGPAFASSTSPFLLVGDGSGSTISGVGTWVIDEVRLDTAPSTIFIPEPTTGLLAASVGLLALRRRA